METIATPIALVTSVAEFRFSPKLNAKLQELMDRNTEGQLSEAEQEELAALVELSETIALLRGEALRVLGRTLP
jgi:predicted house-cleaning noncanonical NTP pyrophosphatase (MazG superfamily)